jgi:hypothetical protein
LDFAQIAVFGQIVGITLGGTLEMVKDAFLEKIHHVSILHGTNVKILSGSLILTPSGTVEVMHEFD